MPKNVVCKKCNNLVNDWCEKVIDSPDPDMQRDCQHFCEKTNADRIRSMTDDELADFMNRDISGCHPTGDCNKASDDCKACWLDWLQQPAEDMAMKLKPCPYCNSAEVFYGEYNTVSNTTFSGYKIRCKCGYAYRKSVWCDSAKGAVEAWNRRVDNGKTD